MRVKYHADQDTQVVQDIVDVDIGMVMIVDLSLSLGVQDEGDVEEVAHDQVMGL